MFAPQLQPNLAPNRAHRRAHLQRTSRCRRSTPGRRVQVVPCGEHYRLPVKGGRFVLVAHHFKQVRHSYTR